MSVWGVRVVPEKVTENSGIGLHRMRFRLEFAEGKPEDELFYTDEMVDGFLSSHPKFQNTKMGYILYTVNPEAKVVERFRYYPYGNLSNPQDPDQREALETLGGRGMGYRLFRMTVEHVKGKYPGFRYKEARTVMNRHRKQLEMLSITPGQIMPMSEVARKLQEKDRSHRKTRVKN